MNRRGMTLTEVLTVICIAAVLTAIAIPPYLSFRKRSIIIGSANRLITDMQLARSKALKTGEYVAVIFESDHYFIFVDNGQAGGKPGDYTVNGSEQVLIKRQISPLLNMTTTFSGSRYRFKTFGRIKPGSVTFNNGTGGKVRVIVSAIGRMRMEIALET